MRFAELEAISVGSKGKLESVENIDQLEECDFHSVQSAFHALKAPQRK